MNERLKTKDKELREENENHNAKLDELLRDKFEELKSLKSVIDEQSSIIKSYERVAQKEKTGQHEEIETLKQSNKRLQEENMELEKKCSTLNSRLTECQDELSRIQGEIKHTFSLEEDRNFKLQEKVTRLERELIDRDVIDRHWPSELTCFLQISGSN